MTEYDLMIVNDNAINFMPENEHKEILQNVITICTTLKGSVPMDREIGVSPKIIDEPVNIARAKISSEIIDAVRKFEPRAKVTRLNFEEDENGEMKVRIRIRI